jgi:lipopolysaccharide transport system ATP-binding protein
MNKQIFSVEGLSKSYLISHQHESGRGAGGYHRLSEELSRYPRKFYSRFSPRAASCASSEEFWALKDVSFQVNEGEVVGIIGRNGAGKSTLLKILSRITEPTSGRVTLRGRVASLLEVGTGFHPELTGRENVFLNGAILGMKREEIKRNFDEIIDFAGVEKFLDTPVKRYSSGMYVRLAFAVAAHLDPEILVVDEVLAVGDVEFQKKCLGKMKDVASGGRTVIFVSHNLATLRQLCRTGILLEKGKMQFAGEMIDVLSAYSKITETERESVGVGGVMDLSQIERVGHNPCVLQTLEFRQSGTDPLTRVRTGDSLSLVFTVMLPINVPASLSMQVQFKNTEGQPVFGCLSSVASNSELIANSVTRICCSIPRFPLLPGRYILDVWIKNKNELLDILQDKIDIVVNEGDFFGTNKLNGTHMGQIVVAHEWSVLA